MMNELQQFLVIERDWTIRCEISKAKPVFNCVHLVLRLLDGLLPLVHHPFDDSGKHQCNIYCGYNVQRQ